MWSKRQSGVTLVELIVAMVIIGVAVAGVTQVFNLGATSSVNPVLTKQLRAVAEGLMDEIQRQPFAASANAAPSATCSRNTYNDIFDYNNYNPGKVCTINGEAITGLAGITVSVTVAATDTLGIDNADACLITITATQGTNIFTLRGWRSNFAK